MLARSVAAADERTRHGNSDLLCQTILSPCITAPTIGGCRGQWDPSHRPPEPDTPDRRARHAGDGGQVWVIRRSPIAGRKLFTW